MLKCVFLNVTSSFPLNTLVFMHFSSEIIKRAVSGLSLTVQMVEVDIGFRT